MKRFILPLIMVLINVLEVIYLPIYTESKRQNLSQAPTTVITSNTLSLTAAAASAPKKKTTTKKKVTTKKKKKEKYPEARKIWNYLKKMGLNNYVAAGIMGNIMAEVGGQTLNIRPNLYGAGEAYYGICQWSRQYFPAVQGKNLDYQLSFLKKTIQQEFKTFGYKYSKGFTYKKFTKLKNEKQAALAFAKVYERCSSRYYAVRQVNATKAYNYFVK